MLVSYEWLNEYVDVRDVTRKKQQSVLPAEGLK